jgi:hypothetical protein
MAVHRTYSDVVFFGVLLLFSGATDIYIIIANPGYNLPVFGVTFTGPIGWFIKLVAPPIHFIAGYGAIWGRKWAYPLLMLYSLYGLMSAVVNRLQLPPPHRIRTVFIAATLLFMGYLYARRDHFHN